MAEYSGVPALLAEYIYLDGQRLCKGVPTGSNGEYRFYYHPDVLGTPLLETDDARHVVGRTEYYPFGEEVRPGSSSDPQRFTGKELDSESGLYYFGARYYDAHLGRFVSVDPVAGKNADPQTWNRYAYGRNNPFRFIDPNGRETYLVLYGRGYMATDLRGQEHDVGALFERAAETRKAEIEASLTFNPRKDRVELRATGTPQQFIEAVNARYEKGPIRSIDVFSHGYPGLLNLGERPQNTSGKWFEVSDVANLSPALANGATMRLYGCNTAVGQPSIAEALSRRLGIAVTGSSGPSWFDNPSPAAGNSVVHEMPQGGRWVTFQPPTAQER